jgi:hypothetical protein
MTTGVVDALESEEFDDSALTVRALLSPWGMSPGHPLLVCG